MRHRQPRALAFAAAALLVLPTALQAQGSDEARAAIAAASEQWARAYNAGDAAGVAALYTADAMLLPPGGEPVTGREKVLAYWQQDMAGGAQVKLETKEVHGHGDGAVEVGGYVANAEDGTHLDHGKYVVVWKKVDGSWKLHRDIWNSSMGQ